MPMVLFPAYKVCLNLSAESDADGLPGFRQRQKGATVRFDPWSCGERRFNPARVERGCLENFHSGERNMKSKEMVLMIAAATVLAGAASSSVQAAALHKGQWSIGGVQQICLQGDGTAASPGTWYYTTYSSGSGGWQATTAPNVPKYLIYGNYNSTGNDSIEVRAGANYDWMEWQTDLSYQQFQQGTITYVKKKCDAAAAPSLPGQHTNPQL